MPHRQARRPGFVDKGRTGRHMRIGFFRTVVFSAALTASLAPLTVLAQVSSEQHQQNEVVNAQAQFQQAHEQATSLQGEGNLSAQNERLIAALKAEAMRVQSG